MPPKRKYKSRRGNETHDPQRESSSTKPKKQRVSLACDACRSAREKCDGKQPQCGTCVAQQRSCSYTTPTKKRGVQTGYMRTIELSLAWIFHQAPECEQALVQLLTQDSTNSDAQSVLGRGDAGRRLQRVWSKSRGRKAICDILAGATEEPPPSPSSQIDGESDTGPALEDSTQAADDSDAVSGEPRMLKLPNQWRKLLSIYELYAHCWLPIIDPQSLVSTAAMYPTEGFPIDTCRNASKAVHAELWTALAVATLYYQEKNGLRAYVSGIAHGLGAETGSILNVHSVRAMILQTLVLLGSGNTFEASLVIGKAARLASQLNALQGDPMAPPAQFQRDTIVMAGSLLETFTYCLLDQPSDWIVQVGEDVPSTSTANYSRYNRSWQPNPDDHLDSSSWNTSQPIAEPVQTLIQLYRFSKIIRQSMDAKRAGNHNGPGPETLVAVLDPRFAYCNSLISRGSVPLIPAAFLVKMAFLVATAELSPDLGSTLLPSFLDAVDSTFASFGPHATPPLTLVLLDIIRKRSNPETMRPEDLSKLDAATERLRSAWATESRAASVEEAGQAAMSGENMFGADRHLYQMQDPSCVANDLGFGHSEQLQSTVSPIFTDQPPKRMALAATATPQFGTETTTGRNNTLIAGYGDYGTVPEFDYDAMFEQLGSIDYGDSAGPDARFMTNLGFAPGSDLAEIFQGDFGV